MKRLAYLLFALSLLLIFTSVLLIYSRDLIVIRLPVGVHVGDSIGFGFDLNSSALHFGNLLPESGSTRYVSITNPYDYQTYMVVTAQGNISSLLRFNNSMYFLPGETRRVGITVSLGKDVSDGDYSGMVLFHFRRIYS